jgi:hypothetical protein
MHAKTYTFEELQNALSKLEIVPGSISLYDVTGFNVADCFGRLADAVAKPSLAIKPSDMIKLYSCLNESFKTELANILSGIKIYKDLLAAIQIFMDVLPFQDAVYIPQHRIAHYRRQLQGKKEHDQYLQKLIESNIALQKELSVLRVEHEKNLFTDFYSRMHINGQSSHSSKKVEALIASISANTLRTKSVYSLMAFNRLVTSLQK